MIERTSPLNIQGNTSLYGIIGHPVTHSLSPIFQQRFIAQKKVNAAYVPFPVEEEKQLSLVLQGLRHAGIQGLNVTVPYKEHAFKLSQPDQDATQIGAVNTLYPSPEGWRSSNTDWQGVKAVIENKEWHIEGSHVLLFGAGGTARAMVHALSLLGIRKLSICNRTMQRAEQLEAHIHQQYPQLKVQTVAWNQTALNIMSECRLLINSSSIGLRPQDHFPFKLYGDGYALDAVYQPSGKTAFRKAARVCGRETLDGLPMLLAQGAASFALWHQQHPDWLSTLLWLESTLQRDKALLWEKKV